MKYSGKTNRAQHLVQWKKARAEVEKSSQKEQEGELGKNCQLSQQLCPYKSSLEQNKTA